MKRSEMLKLISKELDITNFRSWEIDGNIDDLADSILSKIEENGMLPPFDSIKYQRTWRDGGIGYEWEPENET